MPVLYFVKKDVLFKVGGVALDIKICVKALWFVLSFFSCLKREQNAALLAFRLEGLEDFVCAIHLLVPPLILGLSLGHPLVPLEPRSFFHRRARLLQHTLGGCNACPRPQREEGSKCP